MDVMTTGRVEGGKLHVRRQAWLKDRIAHMKDGEVTVTVARKHATRSGDQNAYWWGVCVHLVSEHTGYDPDEVHQLAKQMFLPKALAVPNGNGEIVGEYVIGGTTTTLTKIEFGEFVERFRRWAAETLDVNIPDPDVDWRDAGEAA